MEIHAICYDVMHVWYKRFLRFDFKSVCYDVMQLVHEDISLIIETNKHLDLGGLAYRIFVDY